MHVCLSVYVCTYTNSCRRHVQWTQNNFELQLRHWKRGREDWKGRWEQNGKESLSMCSACVCNRKRCCPRLISTQSVAFSYTDLNTALYFVNERNYRTLAMQAHALTRTRYFCSLNVIILHLIVYKEGLCYLSVCAIASRSSPPPHACICNGHPGLELCCVSEVLLILDLAPSGCEWSASRCNPRDRIPCACWMDSSSGHDEEWSWQLVYRKLNPGRPGHSQLLWKLPYVLHTCSGQLCSRHDTAFPLCAIIASVATFPSPSGTAARHPHSSCM
jgi:hypothetical protein